MEAHESGDDIGDESILREYISEDFEMVDGSPMVGSAYCIELAKLAGLSASYCFPDYFRR